MPFRWIESDPGEKLQIDFGAAAPINRPLEDWGKLIGDVPSTTAILDGFLSNAEVLQITGDSYRLRGHRADKQTGPASPPKFKTGQTRELGPKAEAAAKAIIRHRDWLVFPRTGTPPLRRDRVGGGQRSGRSAARSASPPESRHITPFSRVHWCRLWHDADATSVPIVAVTSPRSPSR